MITIGGMGSSLPDGCDLVAYGGDVENVMLMAMPANGLEQLHAVSVGGAAEPPGLKIQLALHERQQVWMVVAQVTGDPLAVCFGQSQGDSVDEAA